jgi:hypothetical protein
VMPCQPPRAGKSTQTTGTNRLLLLLPSPLLAFS